MPITPYQTPTLTELPGDVVCEAPPALVEDALELLAVVSLPEASLHPSELHTKFHVLGCGELLLPAVPATPAKVVVPSAESLPGVEPWVDAVFEDAISVVEACTVPDDGEPEEPVPVWSLPGVEPWGDAVVEDMIAVALDEGEPEALDPVWAPCCADGGEVEAMMEEVVETPVSSVEVSPLLPLTELRAGAEVSTLADSAEKVLWAVRVGAPTQVFMTIGSCTWRFASAGCAFGV
jgi:hypothetical protein